MDYSYLAGFFDGEGNIHIIMSKTHISIQVRIYNAQREILESIKEFINMGHIYQKKKTMIYELTIGCKEECKKFLENIYPYSVIKRNQIDYLFKNFNFDVGKGNKSFDHQDFNNLKPRRNKKPQKPQSPNTINRIATW